MTAPTAPSLFTSAGTSNPGLKDVAELLKSGQIRNVCVLAGAGLSVSAGLPDFRSPKTGLYDNLAKFNLPYPEAVFDIDFFTDHPEPFFTLAKELYPGNYAPTPAHCFIKLLEEKSMLRRCWTQNIDCLEHRTGLHPDKIIEAHGSFATARCLRCEKEYQAEDIKEEIMLGKVVRCQQDKCRGKPDALIKSNIVFFGESLPEKFFKSLNDFDKCDLLICTGTSLTVSPFNQLITRPSKRCPRLLVNLEMVGDDWSFGSRAFDKKKDATYIGQCDQGFEELARLCGWEEDLEAIVQRVKSEHKANVSAQEPEKPEVTAQKTSEEGTTAAEEQSKHAADEVADQLAKTQLDSDAAKPENKQDKQ